MQCAGTDRGSTESPLNLQGFVKNIGHYLLGRLMFLEQSPLLFKVYVDASCVSCEDLTVFSKGTNLLVFNFFF